MVTVVRRSGFNNSKILLSVLRKNRYQLREKWARGMTVMGLEVLGGEDFYSKYTTCL